MMDKSRPVDDSVFICFFFMFRELMVEQMALPHVLCGARGKKCAALDEATELFHGCYLRFGTCHSP